MQEKPIRRPYNAESVQYVAKGRMITALYIPDQEQAKNPAHVLENILDHNRYGSVEVVAWATRYYKHEGAVLSGWIINSGQNHSDDPYPNKRDAQHALRLVVADYFTPHGSA